jgi:hypothetical protein
MRKFCPALAVVTVTLPLAACQGVAHRPEPGTPQYAAYLTSRGYDCGLSVQRGRLIAVQRGPDRAAYVSAGQGYAVRAYNKPEGCGTYERAEVAAELRRLARQ